MNITPIGIVKNGIHDASTVEGWGQVESEIHVEDSLAAGLQNVDDWSHVIVIFLMNEATFNPDEHLVQHPRGREDMPEVGVFATRDRERPNQIGISAVKILNLEGNVLKVRGLDAINDTPVLDIKPYAPLYDGAYEPEVPMWFIRLMQGYF